MAAVIDGEFFGALNTIDAGSGYWLVADAPFVFEYNEPGQVWKDDTRAKKLWQTIRKNGTFIAGEDSYFLSQFNTLD